MAFTFIQSKNQKSFLGIGKQICQQIEQENKGVENFQIPDEITNLITKIVGQIEDSWQKGQTLEAMDNILKLKKKFPDPRLGLNLIAVCAYLIQQQEDNEIKQKAIDKYDDYVLKYTKQGTTTQFEYWNILVLSLYGQTQHKQAFTRLLEFSEQNNLMHLMFDHLQNVLETIKTWNLDLTQQLTYITFIISNLKGTNQEMIKIKNTLIIHFIQQYSKDIKDKTLEENLQKFFVELLNKDEIQKNFQQMERSQAFQVLSQKNPELSKAFQHYLSGNLDGFLALNKENLQKSGIDMTIVDQKIRIQKISQFCQKGDLISYKEFSDKIKVPLDDAEDWVILAIQYKIIEAQMNQYEETILITANHAVYYSLESWKQMSSQIDSLINKFSGYLYQQKVN